MIPYLDLKKINAIYEDQFHLTMKSFLDIGHYINGNQVSLFEKEFATFCGVKYCCGTANGLDALTLILKAYMELGLLSKGDKVAVPANTFIASILSVIHAGLQPVLIEPNPNTFNIDLEQLKHAYDDQIKAIIVVHLYGQLCDVTEIAKLCEAKNLLLIEDAAQAHGAESASGLKAGGLGHAAAFSFYPTKNLGALGDAGGITTNDKEVYEMVKQLSNYGSESKYHHTRIGYNSRLDELQAGFLRLKLANLNELNDLRREIAIQYLDKIKNPKVVLPHYSGKKDHVFYVFAVRVQNREDFRMYLTKHQIETHIHYPVSPCKQPCLNALKLSENKISEAIHNSVVSLPLNQGLTNQEIMYIIDIVNAY